MLLTCDCPDILPTGITVRNQETTFSMPIANFIYGQPFSFQELWPGDWTVELVGKDPVLGKRVLRTRNVRVDGTEVVELEFTSLSNFE